MNLVWRLGHAFDYRVEPGTVWASPACEARVQKPAQALAAQSCLSCWLKTTQRTAPMPTTTFNLPTLITQADAEAVMFELQDLPCISNAGVDLAHHRAWAEHTRMIDPADIASALTEAGHPPSDIDTTD